MKKANIISTNQATIGIITNYTLLAIKFATVTLERSSQPRRDDRQKTFLTIINED